MPRLLLTVLCLLSLTSPARTEPTPLQLHLTPHEAFYPTTIQAKLVVEPHYLNRMVCLAWESQEAGSKSSCWQVEGQYAAKVYDHELKHLQPGEYQVMASVIRVRETISTTVQTVRIHDPHRV